MVSSWQFVDHRLNVKRVVEYELVFPTASSPQAMKDPAKNDKVPPFLSSLILGKPDGMPNQLKIKVCSELNYKIHTVTYTLITHSPKKRNPKPRIGGASVLYCVSVRFEPHLSFGGARRNG